MVMPELLETMEVEILNLEDIKKLRATLDEGVKDTPWEVYHRWEEYQVHSQHDVIASEQYSHNGPGLEKEHAEFIAAAPEMIDFLLKHIEELEKEKRELHNKIMKEKYPSWPHSRSDHY